MAPAGERFGLVAWFELRDGHEADFDQLVVQTLTEIEANEPGTLVYAVHRVENAPSSRVFYELYADRAAFEAHEAMPYVRSFLRERSKHLRQQPTVWFVSPEAGVLREGVTFDG